MPKFTYLILFTFLFLISCSDNNCTVDDWTGTYVGKRICGSPIEILQTEDEVTFTISRNTTHLHLPSNTIVIGLKTDHFLIIEECNLIGQATEQGFLPTYQASGKLSGDKVKFQIETPLNAQTCKWEAKKQ